MSRGNWSFIEKLCISFLSAHVQHKRVQSIFQEKAGQLRILGRSFFKKRKCPTGKCANGQPVHRAYP
jgi:hypothetical protein